MARKLKSSSLNQRRSGKVRKSRPRRRNNFVRPVELGVERLEPRWVLASPGSLDVAFDPIDHDGVLVTNLGLPSTADIRFNAITAQADGKIIAAGIVDPLAHNAYDFLVARFNTDGSLDSSFGSGGFTSFDFNVSADSSTAQDVAIDSAGRIVVVGDGPNASEFDSWVVARLTPNGVLDSSFGGGTGKVTTSWGSFSGQAHAVAIQSNDQIVVAGDVRTPSFISELDFGIARYNTDGTLDTNFGSLHTGKIQTDFFTARDVATDVAIQPDGKIISAGYARNGVQSENFAMLRFNTDGTFDSTFGAGGMVNTDIVTTDAFSQDEANSIAIQPNGKIVLGGFTFDGADFAMARYLANGTLDTTFNPVPDPVRPSAPGTLVVNYGGSDLAWSVAVQPDGRYVLAGHKSATGVHNDNDAFALARINSDGSFDSTFGTGGKVTTPITNFVPGAINYAFGQDMTIGPDGKIVEVGYVATSDGHEKAVVARYESGILVQSISGPADINEGQTYTLTLTSSDPTTSQWQINWGDSVQTVMGNPSSVTHVYADGANNYTIIANVTTSTSTSPAGNTVAVNVHNVAPTLAISGVSSVNEGSAYTLNLSSSDPGADTITSWAIDWGNGTQVVLGNPASVVHTYPDGPSSFTISASATDEDGTYAAGNTVSVTVNNVAPTLAISGSSDVNEGSAYTLNLSSSDPGTDTINQWTINWGNGTEIVSGHPGSITHVYPNGPATYTISATATDEDGTYSASNTVAVTVNNVAPTVDSATFSVQEDSPNGTVVGTVTAHDPGADTLSFSITGGTGAAAFAINAASGQITVANGVLLDFDANPTLTLNVQANDGEGGIGSATMTINLIRLPSISGVVYVDVNQDGLFDYNEPGIDGVTIKLLDQNGNAVLDAVGQAITAVTAHDGLYVFNGLQPGTYQVAEVQPTGVNDGAEHLGTLGGTIVANDRMQLTIVNTNAYDYAFAELGQQLRSGDAAGIGFWQNKNGQALIAQGGTQLANWLTSNFGNIFGNTLVGMTGTQVATFYRDQVFKGLKLGGPAKVDAQFMAVALGTYFTNSTLAGQVAAAYGFYVTGTGLGTNIVNVGTKGAAFNVANGTNQTVMQLLLATNSMTDQPNSIIGFAAVYDRDGNGTISAAEASLRTMANDIFSSINESGGI